MLSKSFFVTWWWHGVGLYGPSPQNLLKYLPSNVNQKMERNRQILRDLKYRIIFFIHSDKILQVLAPKKKIKRYWNQNLIRSLTSPHLNFIFSWFFGLKPFIFWTFGIRFWEYFWNHSFYNTKYPDDVLINRANSEIVSLLRTVNFLTFLLIHLLWLKFRFPIYF